MKFSKWRPLRDQEPTFSCSLRYFELVHAAKSISQSIDAIALVPFWPAGKRVADPSFAHGSSLSFPSLDQPFNDERRLPEKAGAFNSILY